MIRRQMTDRVLTALRDRPVVLIAGVRQSGKTTLARSLREHGYDAQYVTLDDATTLAAAQNDPAGFIEGLGPRVILDEVQHAPALLPAIKVAVDRNRAPGRFVLTGSANIMVLPRISESLAGRMEVLTLWPLSASEIAGTQESICDRLFAATAPFFDQTPRAHARSAVIEAIVRGGYPEPIAWASDRRRDWFDSYLTTMLRREVRDISDIDGIVAMPRLVRVLAARVSGLLSVADVGRAVEMPYTTLRRYMAILEAAYLVCPLPAWSVNLGLRAVKAPKLHLVDTGLTAHLQDAGANRLASDPRLLGPLLESYVVGELRKGAGIGAIRPAVYHWRLQTGTEADAVLEDRSGRIVGVEVKASASLKADDVRGLRALRDATGDRFVRGIIAYLGDSVIPFAANIHAVPVADVVGLRDGS